MKLARNKETFNLMKLLLLYMQLNAINSKSRRGEVSLDPTSSYVETPGYAFWSAREILNVPRYMSGLIGPPEGGRCQVYHGTYFLDI